MFEGILYQISSIIPQALYKLEKGYSSALLCSQNSLVSSGTLAAEQH